MIQYANSSIRRASASWGSYFSDTNYQSLHYHHYHVTAIWTYVFLQIVLLELQLRYALESGPDWM